MAPFRAESGRRPLIILIGELISGNWRRRSSRFDEVNSELCRLKEDAVDAVRVDRGALDGYVQIGRSLINRVPTTEKGCWPSGAICVPVALTFRR